MHQLGLETEIEGWRKHFKFGGTTLQTSSYLIIKGHCLLQSLGGTCPHPVSCLQNFHFGMRLLKHFGEVLETLTNLKGKWHRPITWLLKHRLWLKPLKLPMHFVPSQHRNQTTDPKIKTETIRRKIELHVISLAVGLKNEEVWKLVRLERRAGTWRISWRKNCCDLSMRIIPMNLKNGKYDFAFLSF